MSASRRYRSALAVSLLHDLERVLREAQAHRAVRGIVIKGDRGKFSGGFDITAIRAAQSAQGGKGVIDGSSLLTAAVEQSSKPIVAAIEGLALGGGLELAMSCHARLSAPGAMLGLPELNLGVIPGFGGTQRLPRLIGLQTAIKMILSSKPIRAEMAQPLGLVDRIVPRAELLTEATELALELAASGQWKRTLARTDKIEPAEQAQMIVGFARAQTQKKAPAGVVHPLLCLDAILEGAVNGGEAGLRKEAEVFERVLTSDTAKSLVHVFFAQRATAKVGGVSDRGLKPRAMRRVAVVGGGLMGSGIATSCIQAGIEVLMKEINPKFLEAGIARVRANLFSKVKKGRMTPNAFEATMKRLKGTLDYSRFKHVDMVIEAAVEAIPLKQKIFKELCDACSPTCILATNTSTINIDLVSKLIPDARDRVCGLHYFSPAHVMPLLEIVRTEATSPQVLLDSLAFAKRTKKVPVVVGNCTGFAVNRVFFPYGQTAMMLLDMGVDPYAIDKAIGPGKGFGMPMGPLRLNDLVGMATTAHVGKQFVENFPERSYANGIVPSMVEAKRLGETTKMGFYKYGKGRKAEPDPEGIAPFLQASKAAARLPAVSSLSPQGIQEAIFFPVVNESARVLAEGVVERAADLDIATVLSMGFPAHKGGIIKWADTVGARRIVDGLEAWQARVPAQHKGFFEPCALLKQAAARGIAIADAGAVSQLSTKSKM